MQCGFGVDSYNGNTVVQLFPVMTAHPGIACFGSSRGASIFHIGPNALKGADPTNARHFIMHTDEFREGSRTKCFQTTFSADDTNLIGSNGP